MRQPIRVNGMLLMVLYSFMLVHAVYLIMNKHGYLFNLEETPVITENGV